ncbi:MAG: hypothetical protein ABW321_13475, partial [Polyangiales bacterium]
MRALQVFVVLGSSLLFMLQPLVGRLLLPIHGGSFQVWTTCMLFFQLALLVSYAYAHLALPRIGRLHRALLLLSLPCAPLALEHLPARAGSIRDILLALSVGVLLPFCVLGTTSILAQTRALSLPSAGTREPYTLYAYSNVGSLLGLLSYPFLLEPLLGLRAQRTLWAAAYLVYAVMAWRLAPHAVPPAAQSGEPSPVSWRARWYWISVSACACSTLLGLTNVVSLGAGSIPLIWVLTLAAYLLGFVAAFAAREGGFQPAVLAPEVLLLALVLYNEPRWLGGLFAESTQLALQLGCLFWLTWTACAELHRTRPAPRALSDFYLAIALGGALGEV